MDLSVRRIAVVGSGQRVVQTALPVLATLTERFELAGVFSRRAKTILAGGTPYEVEPLEALDAARMMRSHAQREVREQAFRSEMLHAMLYFHSTT